MTNGFDIRLPLGPFASGSSTVTPHCAGHVWYAPDGHWVRAVLEMRGETVEYVQA